MSGSKIRVAILDDYQGIAPEKFSRLTSRIDVANFPDTLAPDSEESLIQRLQPYHVISTMRERTALPGNVIRSLPNLKLILTTGMKNAAIDISACTDRGIIVAGAKGIGIDQGAKPPTSLDSTLEHTWSLILGIVRNIARDDARVKTQQAWQTSAATGLSGKTLGLLGLGKLGADTARVGVLAFGMKIVAWSSNLTQEAADEKARAFGFPEGTFRVAASKEELLQASDVVSIHYVLSERTRNILAARELALMKPSAFLINTSRGPLVDEEALLDALKQGKIRGAALDVYNVEPLPSDSEWRTTPWGKDGRSEVLLSPHMGYVEDGVMQRWYEDTVANLEKWLDGQELQTKLT
ncbi:D-isomer specific 2-hydroxyacid dehydrogenase [Phialemonium atrogriseum]|uniref:D-isomer specific 2-hydroxyacid dehydrogenase n=1 Tax=Phialemonium atrogriseum TaxID=1093897 RepID=A0AAJ0BPT2_9PEZI|nr:D-isomer specific 2-hydroxyacid dehydrogenase [Phialemonium atrogriseum]KAK1761852.1 D-isomer specific 2-hydroxyacid dehydrogenase [Phialemonium atrogriseum]